MNHHQHTHRINALVSPGKRILIAITLRTNFLAFHRLFEKSTNNKSDPTKSLTNYRAIGCSSRIHRELQKLAEFDFLLHLLHWFMAPAVIYWRLVKFAYCTSILRELAINTMALAIQLNDPNRRAMHCIRNTHKYWNEMFIIGLHIKANSTMFFFFWMQWTRKISINWYLY